MSIRLKYGMSGCDQCLFVGCFLHLRVGSVHATSLSIWIVCAPDVRVCVHRHTHMYMPGITSSPGLSESHSPQPPLCLPPPPSRYQCLRVISWSGIFISSKCPIAHTRLGSHRNGPRRHPGAASSTSQENSMSLLPISH